MKLAVWGMPPDHIYLGPLRTIRSAVCPGGYNAYQLRNRPNVHGQAAFACAPAPKPPPKPAAAPRITVTTGTQVSPTLQTQISPQVSPVFSQLQDSPYARTAGAPRMVGASPQVANQNRELERMRQEEIMRASARRADQAAEMRERISQREIRDERRAEEERDYQRRREEANVAERLRQDVQTAESGKLFEASAADYGEVVQDSYQIPTGGGMVPQGTTIPFGPSFAPSYNPTEYESRDEGQQTSNETLEPGLDGISPMLLIAGAAGLLFLMTQKGKQNATLRKR